MSFDELLRDLATSLTDPAETTGEKLREEFIQECHRVDADPREQQRIDDIADLVDADEALYEQALAAIDHGEKDSAAHLLRQCAQSGIGEAAWLLAQLLEGIGDLSEAMTWYQRACADGDMRAAEKLAALDFLGACLEKASPDSLQAHAVSPQSQLTSAAAEQVWETVRAAQEQAKRIVADAREEADKALDQAVKISRAAQEKAERIITEARNEAVQVVEFASQCVQALPGLEPLAVAGASDREQDLVSCLSVPAESAEALPPASDQSSSRRPGFRFRFSRAGDSTEFPVTLALGARGHEPIARNGDSDGTNFWESLNEDQKRAFTSMATRRVFATGARLMQEGEHGDHVAVILGGLTEIRVGGPGGERVVAERGPGQLIGERAALEVNPRSATVIARETVLALVMRTKDFTAFIATYPAVLKIVENQIYDRLREVPALREPGRQPDLYGGPADDWAAPNRYPRNTSLSALSGQNCTIVRTDVVGFGADDRSDDHRRIIRHACLATTRAALASAWDMSRREDRGDGLLIIVPPGIPTAQVIERLVMILPRELKRHNRIYSGPAHIQLRVAVTVGPVEEDSAGVAGKAIIQASRMLDAPAFKQAIADQAAVLGVVVSSFVYETHIQPGGSSLDPGEYAEVPVRVKETSTSAWMQLIGQLATEGHEGPLRRGR